MKRTHKRLIRMGSVPVIAIVLLVAGGIWFVRRPWPEENGTLTVPGLFSSVKVIRDQWGVPQIYAQNDHDLIFAQGYVHAQDRLWQMEMTRRMGQGTLSAALGKTTIEADVYMRTLGLRQVAERTWETIPDEDRSLLEAYVAGVNAYIDSHRDRLPLEFTLVGVKPDHWTPIDGLMAGGTLASHLSGNNYVRELIRARLISQLGVDTAMLLFPASRGNEAIIVPPEIKNYAGISGVQSESLAVVSEWLGDPAEAWGSNGWAVSGSRTATGAPLLVNDLHHSLQMPALAYANGLHGGHFDCVGFTLPGMPFVLVGHNQHIAWTVTNLAGDVQDVYLEKLDDPQNPKQYEFEGKWYDLDIRHDTLLVKNSEPVNFDILSTRHGPLSNRIVGRPEADPLSIHWTFSESVLPIKAMIDVNWATNWDEFRDALRDWHVPSQNWVYADVQGNIGYQAAGDIPIRTPQHQGFLPVPGWTGEYEWQGFIPFDQLPSTFNPPQGFVVTANNKVVSDDYPYYLSSDWDPGYRAKRITDLLTDNQHVTITDATKIQLQTYSLPAQALRPYLLALDPGDNIQAQALAAVKAWDLFYTTDSIGASIYEAWYSCLLKNTVGDELGPDLMKEYMPELYRSHGGMLLSSMMQLMADPHHPLFDDVNTPGVESRADMIARSWADAVNLLSTRYGTDINGWQWGHRHTITFVHTPFGQSGIAPVEALFNSRTFAMPGSSLSVNAGAYRWNNLFAVYYGTLERTVMDLSSWNNMLAVNSTGQSGQVFHPHRDDQIPLWQNGEYYPVPFEANVVEANARGVLTLTSP